MQENRDLKVILTGNSTVGKTSLIMKHKNNVFTQHTTLTVGVDMTYDKNVEIDGQLYDIAIWDTAGQEKYQSIVKISAQNAHAAMVCFDLSDSTSIETVASWIQFLKSEGPQNIQIIIVGTKKDLQIQYSGEQLQQFQMAWRATFNDEFPIHLTSSKTGEGLNEAFQQLFIYGARVKYSTNESVQIKSFKISSAQILRSHSQQQRTEAIISNSNTLIDGQNESQKKHQNDTTNNSSCC